MANTTPSRVFERLLRTASSAEASPSDAIVFGQEVFLSPDQIDRDPNQPRTDFDPDKQKELTVSIRAHGGNIDPVHVRPNPESPGRFILISGERRLISTTEAGLDRIKAIVYDLSDPLEIYLHQLAENDGRLDLSLLDRARSVQRLMDEFNLTQLEITQRTGFDKGAVSRLVQILNEDDPYVLQGLKDGLISNTETYRLIRRLPPEDRSRQLSEARRGQGRLSRTKLEEAYQRTRNSRSERRSPTARTTSPETPGGDDALVPTPTATFGSGEEAAADLSPESLLSEPPPPVHLVLPQDVLARLFTYLQLGPLESDPAGALVAFVQTLPADES